VGSLAEPEGEETPAWVEGRESFNDGFPSKSISRFIICNHFIFIGNLDVCLQMKLYLLEFFLIRLLLRFFLGN
jgi:hypothetical protein